MNDDDRYFGKQKLLWTDILLPVVAFVFLTVVVWMGARRDQEATGGSAVSYETTE